MSEAVPLVSVVIPVYNAAPVLAEAVNSVLRQTHANLEIFLIDDGSTDSSWELIQRYAMQDKRVRAIQNQQNAGQSKTRNVALRQATGQYVAFVDADDICQPSRFSEQVRYLSEHPEIGVVGSYFTLFREDGSPEQQYAYHANRIFDAQPIINNPTAMCVLSLFEQHGYFDPAYDNAEDTELWHRFFASGVKFYILPQYLYRKRYHAQSVSIRKIRSQVQLLLGLNLRALRQGVRFTPRGYLYLAEQSLYLAYLTARGR